MGNCRLLVGRILYKELIHKTKGKDSTTNLSPLPPPSQGRKKDSTTNLSPLQLPPSYHLQVIKDSPPPLTTYPSSPPTFDPLCDRVIFSNHISFDIVSFVWKSLSKNWISLVHLSTVQYLDLCFGLKVLNLKVEVTSGQRVLTTDQWSTRWQPETDYWHQGHISRHPRQPTDNPLLIYSSQIRISTSPLVFKFPDQNTNHHINQPTNIWPTVPRSDPQDPSLVLKFLTRPSNSPLSDCQAPNQILNPTYHQEHLPFVCVQVRVEQQVGLLFDWSTLNCATEEHHNNLQRTQQLLGREYQKSA